MNADSVHPPESRVCTFERWAERVQGSEAARDRVYETMYPGYALGTGAELDWAMDAGLRLAVDVSHLHMQCTQGVLSEAAARRLFDYDRIAEVHVSANDGTRDAHRPLERDSYGLGWARARMRAGCPTVLECYMHRLDDVDRVQQITLLHEYV